MKTNKKNKIIENEENDYIINNDQEIYDYQNNSKNLHPGNNKKINRINKTQKAQNKSQTGNWIREAKAKYQQEKNLNNSNINKTDSRIMTNNRKPKKIINFDDIPVGGGMSGISGAGMNDFSVEIKVPPKKNNYMQNKSFNENSENNIQYRNATNLRKNLENKTDYNNKSNRNENYFENNNNDNYEHVEMERKNSMVSMLTQTCDKEMLGRSEFIGIPNNQSNNNEMNYSANISRLNNIRTNYSLYDKQDNFGKKDSINQNISNFSNVNQISEFNNNTTQNLREKTETAIQLQNVQRELDNEIEMNKRLQGQIENYKSEFNNLREELVKKSDTINELQQKISKLEKELFLQGNQLIEAEAKPSQENYEDIVNNYEEMKKNFDRAIERIKYLSDENDELREKLMKLEGSHKKKLKKESNKYNNKEKIINIGNNKKSKSKKYSNNSDNEENENENEISNHDEKEENNYEEENNEYNNDNNNDKNFNKLEENKVEEKKEKYSIIPEDNDIFGTKININQNKGIQRPRKIQEDGIPVIKRVEEKDNVKDIMVNNYAANDDIYYNRPPIGKPKVKRTKRNPEFDNNDLNNYQEQKLKTKVMNNEENNEEVKNNDKNEIANTQNNNISNVSNKARNQNTNNNKKGNSIKNITTNVGVFPSQLKTIANEREILNLESQLFNLQKERDLVNDEYLKFPEYPKKREEINAKRKIEIKLEEMNKEISLQKLKIRELKGIK